MIHFHFDRDTASLYMFEILPVERKNPYNQSTSSLQCWKDFLSLSFILLDSCTWFFCSYIRFVLTMENDQLTKELEHPVVTPICVTMAAEVNERQNGRLWKQVCLNGESPFLLINVIKLFILWTIFMPYVCHIRIHKNALYLD